MPKKTSLAAATKRVDSVQADKWVGGGKPKNPAEKQIRLVVDIPDAMHAGIKVKCAQQRRKIREVAENLFQLWLDGKVQI